MNLTQLYYALEEHDWYYMMADDPRAYRLGASSLSRLRKFADDLGVPGRSLLEAFERHHVIDGERSPLPPRPCSGP